MRPVSDPLDLEIRKRIYNEVEKSPGIYFRELQRRLKLATGSLDYHVHFLLKNRLLRIEKQGRFVFYYISSVSYEKEDKDIGKLLRNANMRHIIVHLIDKKKMNALEIAQDVGISPQNLSRYLKMLEEK